MLGLKKTTLMTLLTIATILTLVAFIISIVSISLQRWLSYDVLPGGDTNRFSAYSRYRGLFRECLKHEEDVKKFNFSCYELDRGWIYPDTDDGDYWHIIRLRRANIAMMVLGILTLLAALLLLLTALAMTFMPKYYGTSNFTNLIRIIGVVLLLAILYFLATMFIFHVLIDEEKYLKSTKLPDSYASWNLRHPTSIRYASAYPLAWIALALTSLAALVPLTLVCWGLDRLFSNRGMRTVEERTVITSGPYGQPTVVAGETVQVTTTHTNETARTHPGDSTAPYTYTGVSSTNAY